MVHIQAGLEPAPTLFIINYDLGSHIYLLGWEISLSQKKNHKLVLFFILAGVGGSASRVRKNVHWTFFTCVSAGFNLPETWQLPFRILPFSLPQKKNHKLVLFFILAGVGGSASRVRKNVHWTFFTCVSAGFNLPETWQLPFRILPFSLPQKKNHKLVLFFILAGVGGFEPPKCQSQSLVPYRLATPQYYIKFVCGVEDGTRTHGLWCHKPAL